MKKFAIYGYGFCLGVVVSAVGIYLKAPQPVVFGVSAAVSAFVIVTLNRR